MKTYTPEEIKELKELCVELLDSVELVSEKFAIIQPFLRIYNHHGKLIKKLKGDKK